MAPISGQHPRKAHTQDVNGGAHIRVDGGVDILRPGLVKLSETAPQAGIVDDDVALIEGVEPLGFRPLVEERFRLPMLTTLQLPERLPRGGEAALRRTLLDRYGIEIGGGLGKLAGKVWRVGLMGENARVITVEALLFALRKELA